MIYQFDLENKQVNLIGREDFTLAFTGKFTKKHPDILFAISNSRGLVIYDTSSVYPKEIA